MTTFFRFFILALTPLLAVTLSTGSAFLYGLAATLLLLGTSALLHATREVLRDEGRLWSVLGLGAILVTVLDFVTTLVAPKLRAQWGPFLNWLPFSPLVVLLPLERPAAAEWQKPLVWALKAGFLLTLLLTATGLLRDVLGTGHITLLPGQAQWPIPVLMEFPFAFLVTGAGGFFFAAGAVVAYRRFRTPLSRFTDFLAAEVVSAPEAPRAPEVVAVQAPAASFPKTVAPAAQPENREEWGEALSEVVASLAGSSGEKRRLLVIGAGNGELVYYLSMLCLQHAQAHGGFDFRVRGVDHFSTRIETAVKGVYRDHQLEFMAKPIREAWMKRGVGEEKNFWTVGSEPRLYVQFEVADFQKGQVFYPQPCHVIVLNQGIEYVSDEKKAQLLATVCSNLVPGGALVVAEGFERERLPEGMKRTGTTVFRRTS